MPEGRHPSDSATACPHGARARAIIDAAWDAFIGMSADGLITDWNARAEQLFGWSADEVLGRRLSDVVIPHAMRGAHERGLQHFLGSGEGPVLNHRLEITALHRDGHAFPVEVTVWAVEDDGAWSFNAFVRDATERTRLQQELADALVEAQEASRLKSAFLATISHEIRTPLSGVVAMAGLVLETALDDAQRRYIVALRDSGDNLVAVLNDIVDFSKIEAGRVQLDNVEFDLDQAITSVLTLLSPTAQDKGLALRADVATSVPTIVRGDPLRLRQVLINLVTSAVRSTGSGIVTIAVTPTGEGAARFSVADTGAGIDGDARSQLLDPLCRVDGPISRHAGETGLGLAICAQLVRLMGGTLEVRSRPGRGTTFWFDIALPAVDLARTEPVPDTCGGAGAPGAIRAGRILLADDDDINRIVGVALLERMGYLVDAVADGAEAVAAAGRTAYDAILMDCLMPVMDGYEATTHIRRLDGAARDTPIIATTASAMVGDREKCISAGMDDYVSKPLDPAALAGALAQSRRQAARPLAAEGVGSDGRSDPGADATIDPELLEGLRELESTIGPVAYAAVCSTFLRTCPDQVDQLKAAVADCDTVGVLRLAHTLKGSMASMGAARLSRLAAQLERSENDPDQVAAVIVRFDAEFAHVRDLLSRSAASC